MRVAARTVAGLMAFALAPCAHGGVAPPPAGAARTAVAAFSWRIDGVGTAAQEFRVRESVDAVAAGVRAEWRAEHPHEPVATAQAGASRLLGQRVGRTFRVAQLTPERDGTTRLLISSRSLDVGRSSGVRDVPLASGSRVIRRLEMTDGPRPQTQVYALTTEPPPLAEARFDAAARRAGWDRVPVTHRTLATVVQAWRRGGEELLVVTTPIAAGTGLLLHLTAGPAGAGTP